MPQSPNWMQALTALIPMAGAGLAGQGTGLGAFGEQYARGAAVADEMRTPEQEAARREAAEAQRLAFEQQDQTLRLQDREMEKQLRALKLMDSLGPMGEAALADAEAAGLLYPDQQAEYATKSVRDALEQWTKMAPSLGFNADQLMGGVGDLRAKASKRMLSSLLPLYKRMTDDADEAQMARFRQDTRPLIGGLPLAEFERLLPVGARWVPKTAAPTKATSLEGLLARAVEKGDTQEASRIRREMGLQAAATRAPKDEGSNAAAPILMAPPTPQEGRTLDPATGLTLNAIYQGAIMFALTGQMPAAGRASDPRTRAKREAYQNTAAELAAQAGVDLGTLRAEYAGQRGSITKQIARYNATKAIAEQAKGSLENARQAASEYPRTGSPLYNRYKQYVTGQTLTGDPRLTKLEVFVYDAARDYARTTSGGAESVAQMTDTANAAADRLLNAAQTPAAFEAALQAMARGMDTATNAQEAQIGKTSQVIRRFLNPAADAVTPKGVGVGLTYEDYLKSRKGGQ